MKFDRNGPNWLNLPNLPLTLKVLFIGYLLVIGLGLCMAGLQIMMTHGMADGKIGLALDEVVYRYCGNRTGTTLEAKLCRATQGMAPKEVRTEIIKWARNGAPEARFPLGFRCA